MLQLERTCCKVEDAWDQELLAHTLWCIKRLFLHRACVSHSFDVRLSIRPRNGALPQNYTHVWALCSDNGGDQAAFRKQLKTELATGRSDGPYKNQLIFDVPCMKHQMHLLTQDMLKVASKFLASCGKTFGYFGSLAKICHCWRAHGQKLSKVWATIVPQAYSYAASRSVPPLAVAGRWGTIDSSSALLRL